MFSTSAASIEDAIYPHHSQIRFINPLTGPQREGREATRSYRINSVKIPCKRASSAKTGRAAAHTWSCQIPVQDAGGCEGKRAAWSRYPGSSEWSVLGEQRFWGNGREGGERAASVRSCLLIPELTASLRVRQTPHPTALPPRRDAHTPLLHATDGAPPLSVSFHCCASLFRVTGERMMQQAAGFYLLHG